MVSILVIEDETLVQEAVRRVLEGAGYAVTIAADGKSGVRQFKASRPDLVLTDILMPEQEGVETIREIRRSDPSARILAMSGGGAMLTPEYLLGIAEALGANAMIAKPFAPGELLTVVRDCLSSAPTGA